MCVGDLMDVLVQATMREFMSVGHHPTVLSFK